MQHPLTDPLALLSLLVMSAVTGGLLGIFIRYHAVGVFLVLTVNAWAATGTQTSAVVLGAHVYPADIVSLCAAGVGLCRLLVHGVPRRAGMVPLLGLIALTLWATLRGIASFGLQTAVNDVRVSFGYLLAAALYTATMPAGVALESAVRRAWGTTAVAYAGLCVIGWAKHGLHAVTDRVTDDGSLIDPRPVPAATALLLAQAAALLLLAPSDQGNGTARTVVPAWIRRRALPLVLLLFVLLLQHRTVWVVTAAMVMTAWALSGLRERGRLLSSAVAMLSVALTMLAYQLGAFGTIGATLATSVEEVQDNDSTFDWRVAGWQQLLTVPKSLVQWLSGMPFGSGYDRIIGGHLVTVGPHNYYLHLGLRLGTVGLVLLTALYVLTWWRLRNTAWSVPLRVLLVGQLVFFMTYSASSEQGVLVGLCMWCLRTRAGGDMPRRKTSDEVPARVPTSAAHPARQMPTAQPVPGVSR